MNGTLLRKSIKFHSHWIPEKNITKLFFVKIKKIWNDIELEIAAATLFQLFFGPLFNFILH